MTKSSHSRNVYLVAMGSEGRAIRYLRSTVVPADEALLCVFEAGSEELVHEVYARAGVPFEPLSVAIADESEWLDADSPPGAGGAEQTGQGQTEKTCHDEGKDGAGQGRTGRKTDIWVQPWRPAM